MHPSDNSVIKTLKCEIRNKVVSKNIIIKDNFTFGMNESKNFVQSHENYMTREEREKESEDLKPGNEGGELWCTLGDPSVKFFVENEFDEREN